MNGKVIFITGAKGGLGNSVTQAFLNAGGKVVGTARSIRDADFPHPNFTALQSDINTREQARAARPVMQRQGAGNILAIGSRTAVEPCAALGAYSASKAALVSLVRTIALENKKFRISANAILPGTMDTPANREAMAQADFTKWVQPNQVASMLAHLSRTPNVTGAVIPIYGGEL
jgi:NAD(P)-dependent dehydrogenase (short-subunit alcohol dehydrogenase family)